MTLTKVVTLLVALAFITYGVLCVTSVSMVEEFRRFGLENLRLLTGYLEIAGGIGLLVGLRWPLSLTLSSAGLALLMLIAFAVRLWAKDTVAASLPSATFVVLNLYILVKSLQGRG